MTTPHSRPILRPGGRLVFDEIRGQHALLHPEGVLLLNDSAGAILLRCDGSRTLTELADELAREYTGPDRAALAAQASGLLNRLVADRLVLVGEDGATRTAASAPAAAGSAVRGPHPGPPRLPAPLGVLAELTYRCPLQCGYCSNPLELALYRDELTTAQWMRVIDQARGLGALQFHLSGGEPLVRRDLVELLAHARGLGMYVSLVTSGVGLTEGRLGELVDAGLDHVQLSIQDSDRTSADAIAGIRSHTRKLAVAEMLRDTAVAFTVNAVLHRGNIDHTLPIVELAAAMGAQRLELANTQYYGWALRNRDALLPSRRQLEESETAVAVARERFGERMQIVYVLSDYYETRPKPCMNGWGTRQLIVAPNGDVLPCPAAAQIPDLGVRNVRKDDLGSIWHDSAAFTRFRGTDWMPEPCVSCDLREIDFGGCRCQAYQLTGDVAATDPVCSLSPDHGRVTDLLTVTPSATVQPRRMR
ncbi:pyrroloquinoline quinone biosynthesis protein PqqE [Streptomyces longwoodensis]|uniref:pyrroloquinoline quinone biosynthesis protein PqqE n=1 Tax=Streptomyces longwoodensis TaxID=68231 RepID=UPI0033FA8C8F